MLLMLWYMWLLLIFSWCLRCSFSSHNWVSLSALVWSTITAPYNLCLPLFFSQKNNEFYWLFSLFLPTPSAPSLTSLPAPGGGNENSNKITNYSVSASYLLLSVLHHNLGSWGEGLKPKHLLGPYIFLHRNLITHQFFGCMELLRGDLNTIFW